MAGVSNYLASNRRLVEALIETVSDGYIKARPGVDLLYTSILAVDQRAVEKLVQRGVPVHIPLAKKELHNIPVLPLSVACFVGHREIFDIILKLDNNIEQITANQYTPLMWVCDKHRLMDHVYVVKKLIHMGVDMEAVDNIGRTALIWNSWGGKLILSKYLIKRGNNINKCDGRRYNALTLLLQSVRRRELLVGRSKYDAKFWLVKLLIESMDVKVLEETVSVHEESAYGLSKRCFIESYKHDGINNSTNRFFSFAMSLLLRRLPNERVD